jgi:glycosyltransferase involved in cell wall biosynthesis
MERLRIAIVIPAFNEAETVVGVISAASKYGLPIVVDDGSGDETFNRATSSGASVVRHAVNLGYDQAINSGFKRASELECNYVITMDADGQHDSNILTAFIRALDEGADVVIGIRDHRQRFAEHTFAWIGNAVWGINDPLCGMKAYRIEVYKALGHFDSYESIGTELTIFATRNHCKVVQLPVKTRKRSDSSRFGRKFSANKRILRALWLGLRASTKKG